MNQKRFLGLFLLVTVALTFLLSFVSAETIIEVVFKGIFRSADSSAFNSFGDFLESALFLKILIFILVALIIYSISPFMPFVSDHPWVTWAITIIVAYLATFSLRIEEIKTILITYSALGLFLTAIVPFFAIAAISKRSAEQGYGYFGKIVWILFFFFVLAKFITLDVNEIGPNGELYLWVYGIIGILVVIMFLWEKRMWFILFRRQLSEFNDQMREQTAATLTAELERMNEQILATTNPTAQAKLIQKYNKIAAKARAQGVSWKDWQG